jgi:hypothetical protein
LFKERDRLLAIKQELSAHIKNAKAGLIPAKAKLRKRTPFRDGSIPLNSPKKTTNQSKNLSEKKPKATDSKAKPKATDSKAKPVSDSSKQKKKPPSRLSTKYRDSRRGKEPTAETADANVEDKTTESVDLTDDNVVEESKATRRSPRKPTTNVSYCELDDEEPEDPPLANVDPAPPMNDDQPEQPQLNKASTKQTGSAQPNDKASNKKNSSGTKKKGDDAKITNNKSTEQPPTKAATNKSKVPKDAAETSKKRKEPPVATSPTKAPKNPKKNPTEKSLVNPTIAKDSKTSRKYKKQSEIW